MHGRSPDRSADVASGNRLPAIVIAGTVLMAGAGCSVQPARTADKGLEQGREAVKPASTEDAIGSARQEVDGTLVLDLRAEGPDGIIGHAQLRYPPSDKDYTMISRHLGPIPTDGFVLVKPFPD